jgi:hypothetical protein
MNDLMKQSQQDIEKVTNKNLIMIEPQHILKKASRKMVQNRASFFSIWMLLVQTDGDLQKINTVAFKARL